MMIETVDPGAAGVREAREEYLNMYPEYSDALHMYCSIMEAQQDALEKIQCYLELAEDEKEKRLLAGIPLLDPTEVDIDPAIFRDLVAGICEAVDRYRPGGFKHTDELLSWDGINSKNLPATRDRVLGGEALTVFETWDSDADKNIAHNIFLEALVPFYRKCGSILYCKIEQPSCIQARCPVCGSSPLMGLFRSEDGLCVVECSLCHTRWNVQRARCPFCDETQGFLEYMHIEEHPERRAQFCKKCKVYLKTVDLRGTGRNVLLPLEDIVTVDLDFAAAEDGLKPPGK
ncbi:MAG TPA: formate dehydrogenase accessory protein FdhE [Candidatus Anoxymicrobiaceae bacterium]